MFPAGYDARNEEQSVICAAENEMPIGSVPQSTKRVHYECVDDNAMFRATVSAERNVDVVAKP